MSEPTTKKDEAEVPELTPRQVTLIKETWALVEPNMQRAGLTLFFKLFEIAPDLQDLFPFEGEELSEENELLKKHALQVMESVGMAIGLMGDPEQLKEILIGLGVVHNMKSVQVDSFKPVGVSLVHALETELGSSFTDEVKKAWVTLYGIVQYFMELGMKEGLDA